MQLVKYDEACRAIAEACSFDEVKEIGNRSEALRAYAKQAKNRKLEIDAVEIRTRAERRQGELIIEMRSDRKIAVQGVRDFRNEDGIVRQVPRLSDFGIGGQESSNSQRLAMLDRNTFERELSDWRRKAINAPGSLKFPLRHVKSPSESRGRAASRMVDQKDALDRYRDEMGVRVVDWRAAGISRKVESYRRLLKVAEAFQAALPIANPEPFDTIGMLFEKEALSILLDEHWGTVAVPGLTKSVTTALKNSSHHVCLNPACRETFFDPNFKRRGGRSKFCSDKCREAAKDAGRYAKINNRQPRVKRET